MRFQFPNQQPATHEPSRLQLELERTRSEVNHWSALAWLPLVLLLLAVARLS